jgi:histidyl-tRNA synthetase
MSEFKISKKQIHTDTRMSIIAKHDKTIYDIENEKKNLQKYKKELLLLKKTEGNKEKVLSLTEKIKKIENEEDLTDYLFKAIEVLQLKSSYDISPLVSGAGYYYCYYYYYYYYK